MKRFLMCLLCLCLLASACFVSCESENAAGETVTDYVYVSCVGDGYVIGGINGKGTVKILCDTQGKDFSLFDTLRVEYCTSDLVQEEGTYTAVTGNPASYEWVLNKVDSIRESDPAKGEPVYG